MVEPSRTRCEIKIGFQGNAYIWLSCTCLKQPKLSFVKMTRKEIEIARHTYQEWPIIEVFHVSEQDRLFEAFNRHRAQREAERGKR